MRKNIIKLMLIFLFVAVFFGEIPVLQAKNEDNIRVCLSQGTYSAVFKIVHGKYTFQDTGTRLPIAVLTPGDTVSVNQAGKILTISINGIEMPGSYSGVLSAVPEDERKLNVFSYNNTLYRDGITLNIDSGSILVVNDIDIEHYLYGVVGQKLVILLLKRH